jgi:hypothetical protein
MNESFVLKIISVIVVFSLILLIPPDLGLGKPGIKALPFFIVPFFLIWFPEIAEDYFSSKTSTLTIRRLGMAGLLLLALPAGIALLSLR